MGRRHNTRNPISGDNAKALLPLLNRALCESLHLVLEAKRAHWNVKGPEFLMLHELFDTLHGEAMGFADLLAERMAQVGGSAVTKLNDIQTQSALAGLGDPVDGRAMTVAVADMLAAYVANIQSTLNDAVACNDLVTDGLLTDIATAAEKRLWFIEAHLQAER